MRDYSQAAGSNRQWRCSNSLPIFRASHYQAPATVDTSQPAIFFCLVKHILSWLRSALRFLRCQIARQRSTSVLKERSVFFIVCFPCSESIENFCCTAAGIWKEKENRLLYRTPERSNSNIQSDLLHSTGYRAQNVWLNRSVFVEELSQRHLQQLPN